jgi:hypothetical protein
MSETSSASVGGAARDGRCDGRWAAVGAVVFAAALATAFLGFWGSDLRESVPVPSSMLPDDAHPKRGMKPVIEADYRLAVWAVGRNAYALLHEPTHLFQAEPCHPTPNALALHHPVIAPAIVAAPADALTGDPVAAFNAAVLLKVAIGFAAMGLLVADWTRSPPAGIVAGLLYAFHPIQVEHPYHLFTSDNAWMLFGLYFARRLFERGRWIDAVGVALSCILQMGASFYPFFAAAITALPLLVWLIWHHGVKNVRLSRALLVLALVGAGALLLFAPYLGHEGAELSDRGRVFYAPWSTFLPGGSNFPGWVGALLAIAAFALGRRRALAGISGDPRAALVIAALLVAAFATGGNHEARVMVLAGGEPPPFVLPNPFAALARVLPVLQSVRLPGELALAVREIACILAGFGAAAFLRWAPVRWATAAAALLIVLSFAETLRPPFLGLAAAPPFGAFRIRPSDASLAFFDTLAQKGNRGPLLELPLDRRNRAYTFRYAPIQQLLTAYHHRRTSGCYVSFIPRQVRELASISKRLPEPEALDRVLELGFTTIVIHQDEQLASGREIAEKLRAAALVADGRLVPIATSATMTAYELRDTGR